jgi:DNA-binding winged helix-turn-helix (wHTH) protein
LGDVICIPNRERVVSREELFAQCWPETHVSDAALTSRLRRVREVLGQTPGGRILIPTLHRRGYRLVAAVSNPGGANTDERIQ